MHLRNWVGLWSGLRAVLLEGVVLGGALTAVHTVGLDDAAACSPPPSGFYFNVPGFHRPIPRDGVVFIENTCPPSDCFPLSEATFTVFDQAGSVIEGSVLETPASPGLMIWRPKIPFAPGTYTIEGRHPEYDSAQTYPLEVRDALDVPIIDPTRSAASWEELVASYVCCQEGSRDSCAETSCYPIVTGVTPRVRVGFDFAHSADVAPQAFIYRARAKGAEWPSFTAWHQVSVLFEEVADEYCYELQVQDMAAGGELWEQEGCMPASLVPPTVKEDLEEIDRTLFGDCTVPPAGYEARWCQTFAENVATGSCEDHLYEPACEAAVANCSPIVDAGTSNTADTDDNVNTSEGSAAGSDGGAPGSGATSSGQDASQPRPDGESDGDATGDGDAANDSSQSGNFGTSGEQDAREPSSDDVQPKDSVKNSSSCSFGAPHPSSRLTWVLAGLGVVAAARLRRRSIAARLNER